MGHESLLGSKVKKEKKGAGSPVTSGRDELELGLRVVYLEYILVVSTTVHPFG